MTPKPTPTCDELVTQMRGLANAENVAGMQRFAIRGGIQLGISVTDLRKLARGIKSHDLAIQLWATNIHEARILAALVDEPARVTPAQMDKWTSEFESWDICDEVTDELFIHTPYILERIPIWSANGQEFVRRAAFSSIAALVIHRKDIPDDLVRDFFALMEFAADDDRNFVWKAVNWALRNTAKFRPGLRIEAIRSAKRILRRDTPAARKIAKDALREFEEKFGSETVAQVEVFE